jgi:hypothetical protein
MNLADNQYLLCSLGQHLVGYRWHPSRRHSGCPGHTPRLAARGFSPDEQQTRLGASAAHRMT